MKTIYKKLLFLFLLLPFSVLAQSTLSGVVLDKSSGQPLPGVNVVVSGTSNGVVTDFDGKFKLTKVVKGDKIVFSFIGLKSESIVYSNQTSITVSLQEDANQLSEVVVQVGYGTVKKKDATGSLTTITTKDFNKGANVTAENLLNGRVAGLSINTSGAPGSGSQIRIRGGASLSASNDPLIVIDGLPIDNSTSVGATSILSSLNPATIESMTVLKDASATAIYGSRASNGVIIITTKKGGKNLEAEYNFQLGIGRKVNQVSVFGADQYRNIVGVRQNQLLAADPNTGVNLPNLLGTANTNWQDEIYRTAEMVDQSFTVKGSLFDKIPTRLTVGKTFQEGLRLTNQFDRNTVGLAMNPTFLKDHLKVRLNANYSNEKNRFADGVEGSAIRFDPTQPVYAPANTNYGGYFQYTATPNGLPITNAPWNPVAQLMQTHDNGTYRRTFGNLELDYKLPFFPSVRAVVNVGYDSGNGDRMRTVDTNSRSAYNGTVLQGVKENQTETKTNKLFDGYLVYNKNFSDLAFEATAGYSYQKFQRESFNSFNVLNPNSQAPDVTTYGDQVLVSFFGRTYMTLKDKYLMTLTYRRDGSSEFSPENRWGNFPAAALAWKMKEETFLKDSKVFSDLKLRLGWGVTGQKDMGTANFLYLEPYSIGNSNSQYVFGTVPTNLAVPQFRNVNIKWEETTTANVGFDFGFFNNRLTGSVEAFSKVSKNLLSYAAISDGSNFSNAGFQNIGSLSSKGFEVTLNAAIVKTNDFNWNVNFNATKFERRIDELALGSDVLTGGIGGGTGGTIQIFSQGYTPNSFYVFKQLYDVNGRPIQGAYADLNGDGIVNNSDRYIKYNGDPDFIFGFASNFNYKNLDFSFNLRANLGNHIYNNINSVSAYYSLVQNNTVLGNIPTSVLDTNFIQAGSLGTQSDIYIENASFLRMDNITLGYSFPKWLEGKASLRISAGVQNAFVLTKYSGLDPEITNNGIDNTIYPRPRTLLFGANIKF
jgi:iron complex outermembrane receptor protein